MSATYTNRKRKLEKYVQVVREDGLNTDQNVNVGVTGTPNLWVAGNVTVGGTITGTLTPGAITITSASANALTVGPNGTTNPVFNVDGSVASAATGLNVQGEAAGSGVQVSVTSSGTNEDLIVKALGTGDFRFRTNSPSTVLAVENSTGAQTAVRLSNTGTDGTVAGDVSLYRGATLSGQVSTTGPGDLALRSNNTGKVIVQDNVALPAGGSASMNLLFSSTANTGLYYGSGAPTVSAATGALYVRTDSSSPLTALYSCTGTTNWVQSVITSQATTALGTNQNVTPTAAQLLGGIITQTGATGAGTVTLPTGTQLSTAVPGVAVGNTFTTIYANLGGGFNEVITGQTGSTVVGNATVPTGKNAFLVFTNTGANTWNVYINVSA